jgi:endonuclease/exonuclease/phosphatase family metal-dependent hydrolase
MPAKMGLMSSRVRALLPGPLGWGLLLVVALGVACSTVNYLDPSGPFYETSFAEPRASGGDAQLRVVTFNIAYAKKVELALELLRDPPLQALDVLALQEMDAPAVKRMARELAMNSLYIPSAIHPSTNRDFGCAILSPWPLVEPGKVVLPIAGFGSGVRRSAVRATVLWGDRRVRIYSVHLPSPLGVTGAARRQQMGVLLEDAADSTDPVVIAGDFNSKDVGQQVVAAGYSWPTRDVGATSKFFFFGMSIDHIFVKGLESPSEGVGCGAVADNKGASDHRPVWAVLETPDP